MKTASDNMISAKDFDLYVGNKISKELPLIGADLFNMYATCKQLDLPELEPLTDSLKRLFDAIDTVYDERDRLHSRLK